MEAGELPFDLRGVVDFMGDLGGDGPSWGIEDGREAARSDAGGYSRLL